VAKAGRFSIYKPAFFSFLQRQARDEEAAAACVDTGAPVGLSAALQSKGAVREHVVEWNGAPGQDSVQECCSAARWPCGQITPHKLRHTAATWLMQAGADKWEAAGFLGLSVEMLDRVYDHHHPQHSRLAAQSIGYRRPNETLAVSLA
jgi:hypothetical protein